MELYVKIFESIPDLFTLTNILWLLLGISIGTFFGLMPGLAGPQALALLLPLTYSLDVVSGLFILMGVAGSATCAGSITAILLGIPGTPVNAATVIDGYPLAKQGKAGMAIGAAGTSSVLGGILGAAVLTILLPFGFSVILKFSYAEFFMLALIGICAMSLATGTSFVKGIISSLVGILLATVGYDPILSYTRFNYGSLYLWDGFSVLTLMIGLFAVTEALELLVKKEGADSDFSIEVVGVIDGIKSTFKHYRDVIRSSIIGIIVGIMPGVGGSLAQFLAYGTTVASSKDKSMFGKGDIRGVIGAESSNNAKDGGSLIPALLFGIPGSIDTAILLGAFMIHGITPGLTLLQKNPDVIFTILWALVAATLASVLISFFAGPYLVRLTKVKGPIIGVCVLVLSILGTYGSSNMFGDLIVIMVVGFIGYFMKKHNYSRSSLIVGFLLGGITEANLRLGIFTYGWAGFFSRPIALVIMAIGILMIGYNVYSMRKGRALT